MAPHQHEAPTLNIVVDGHFTEQIGRGVRCYRRGTVAFCPAGVVHSQDFGPGGARQIIFRPQDAWLHYLGECMLDLGASPYTVSAAFLALGEGLLRELRTADPLSVLACEGLMLEIVAAFGRSGAAARVVPAPPEWLRRARDFIHDHASEPISMARLAQAAGRHEIHLAREFRRHFGLSIGGYLRRLRTEQAARLLKDTRRDIAGIALACGFSSHAHLCREFKARFGVTPSQYRASS
jgi:AraC family transcriptional regulator